MLKLENQSTENATVLPRSATASPLSRLASICRAVSPLGLWRRYIHRLSFVGEPLLEQRWMAERSAVQRNFVLGYSALFVAFSIAQVIFAYGTTVTIGGVAQGHREKALTYAAIAVCFSFGVLLGVVAWSRPGFARLERVALMSSVSFLAVSPAGFTWRSVAVISREVPDDTYSYSYTLQATTTEPTLMLVSYFIISMNLLCGLVRARWAPVLYLVAVGGWIAWVLALPGGYVRSSEVEPLPLPLTPTADRREVEHRPWLTCLRFRTRRWVAQAGNDMSQTTYMLAMLAAVSMATSIVLESAQRANFMGKVEQDRQREIEWQRERDLMAVIFHEVRNPLNGTVGHLRLAHAALEGKAPSAASPLPPHEFSMLLENIENAMTCTGLAVEFLQAVSEMEKLQRADLPSPKHTPVLLPQVLREAATVVTPQLTEGVNLRIIDDHVTNGPAVLCDRTLLVEICINLLQNASRFTLEGYVELSCRIVEGGDATEGDQSGSMEIEIAVRDTGTGMSEDEISKICDRYQSVGGRGNFGLGLYLTQRQLSLLGSALRVRSPWQEGQTGSEFAFNLTVRTVESSDQAPATRSISPSKNHMLPPDLRVLLADDVKTNRKLIRLALTRHCGERWEIVEASTGEEALQTFKSETGQARPFELLLLDETYSPEPSALRGSDVIKAIREHEQATHTPPVAIISCTGNTQDKSFLLECGADSVWEKPMPDFRDGSMQEALSEVLRKRQEVRSTV